MLKGQFNIKERGFSSYINRPSASQLCVYFFYIHITLPKIFINITCDHKRGDGAMPNDNTWSRGEGASEVDQNMIMRDLNSHLTYPSISPKFSKKIIIIISKFLNPFRSIICNFFYTKLCSFGPVIVPGWWWQTT